MALVTYRNPHGILEEDRVLAAALRRRKLPVEHPVWDDPSVDWSRFSIAVVRSTWDYHKSPRQFLRWVRTASARVELWNRPRTLRWNTDKRYLADLEAAGVPTVPTVWVKRGGDCNLTGLIDTEGWDEVVVKPAVSAAGDDTYRVGRRTAKAGQQALDRLAARGTTMVQPYLRSVETTGERSLIFLGGRYSHAVRRTPLFPRRTRRAKETVASAPAELREIAALALRASPEEVLYARVDLVRDGHGAWKLLELELTEPSLFFVPFPRGADRLAAEIGRLLSR